ncbi:uncharacterized protein IWZ02DRAFT_208905 [Phyllosticta citriasiana]|uniref:uncharacterized protein n=1 Tax=Phyllosticta citriasiana TaxID=595635 RepID=UPI0030FDCD54
MPHQQPSPSSPSVHALFLRPAGGRAAIPSVPSFFLSTNGLRAVWPSTRFNHRCSFFYCSSWMGVRGARLKQPPISGVDAFLMSHHAHGIPPPFEGNPITTASSFTWERSTCRLTRTDRQGWSWFGRPTLCKAFRFVNCHFSPSFFDLASIKKTCQLRTSEISVEIYHACSCFSFRYHGRLAVSLWYIGKERLQPIRSELHPSSGPRQCLLSLSLSSPKLFLTDSHSLTSLAVQLHSRFLHRRIASRLLLPTGLSCSMTGA